MLVYSARRYGVRLVVYVQFSSVGVGTVWGGAALLFILGSNLGGVPYGLVRRRYTYSEGPPDLGDPEKFTFRWNQAYLVQNLPKTQFKRESFGKCVPPIASFELPVRESRPNLELASGNCES